MIQRCHNERHKDYENYGGRGITVCDRWRNSVGNFLSDMGPRPSRKHSIDRIDVNGNYEPANCRWATITQQNQNRRNSILINGRSTTDLALERKLAPGTLHNRIFLLKWSLARALSTPRRARLCRSSTT